MGILSEHMGIDAFGPRLGNMGSAHEVMALGEHTVTAISEDMEYLYWNYGSGYDFDMTGAHDSWSFRDFCTLWHGEGLDRSYFHLAPHCNGLISILSFANIIFGLVIS